MNQDVEDQTTLSRSFIFECLAARLNHEELTASIKISRRSGFDWDVFLQTADEELVSPLLHQILAGQGILPAEVESWLVRKHDYIVRRNLFLFHELSQILSLLHSAGVETIVLKGAALAETVYKDIGLRPMRDLDLLIAREQQQEAAALLAANGYKQNSAMLGDAYPIGLAKPGIEPVEVELHWTLFHSLHYHKQMAIDWFWETAIPVSTSAKSMMVLGLEAQILHLCGHLVLHHSDNVQLLWFNDLAELIIANSSKIQWDLLIDKGKTFQLILPLQNTLVTLATDWGTPIPERFLEQLEGLPVSEEERRAFRLSTVAKRSEGEGYWLRLKEITGWRQRLVYVGRWFFPSPAALQARYKVSRSFLLPLVYPYHWWLGLRLGMEGFMSRREAEDSQ